MTPAEVEAALPQFDGLISETARQILAGGAELEFDDLCQLLRIKVWRTIARYDPARTPPGSAVTLRGFVFACLRNLRRDIEKRPRRFNASIDLKCAQPDGDAFEERYLSVDAETVYAEVEDEPVMLPSTLTETEIHIISLRLAGLGLQQIDSALGLSRFRRAQALRSIRVKLADWAPDPYEPAIAQLAAACNAASAGFGSPSTLTSPKKFSRVETSEP